MTISVIVPVYNAKTTIDRAIISVYNQSIDNFKIILIDDGSTDGSAEICDMWAAKDMRITTIHLETNKGLSNARNVGLDNVIDDGYVFFLDSDDEISDNAFCKLLKVAQNTNADIIVGGFISKDIVSGQIIDKITQEEYCGEYTGEKLKRFFIQDWYDNCPAKIFQCLQSCLYSTSFLSETGLKFSVKQKFGEDARFMIESYSVASKIYVSDIPSYIYYYNSSAVSKKYYEKYRDSTIEFYKYNLPIIKIIGGRRYYCNLIGKTYVGINSYLTCANNRNVKRKEIYSFIYNPTVFKVLTKIILMRKNNMKFADISRKDKFVALLYLTGFYKKALQLIG